MVFCGTLLKSVRAVGFSEKQLFLESGYFQSEMLGAANFGLVLGNFLVNAMIVIKKYVVKLSRLIFLIFF